MASVTQRKDLLGLPFRYFRPIPKNVTATQLSEPEDVPHPFATDGSFHGEPGDWKIVYDVSPDGRVNVAICEQSIFSQTYEQVAGNTYRKRVSLLIEAVRLEKPLDIITHEGPSHGIPGDWLLIGVADAPYFNSDADFNTNWVLVD